MTQEKNINLGIFGNPSTEKSESLLTMSQEERAADYDMAVANGDSRRLQEHEDFIQSVMKGLSLYLAITIKTYLTTLQLVEAIWGVFS